jgi:leucyl aminopeptidase
MPPQLISSDESPESVSCDVLVIGASGSDDALLDDAGRQVDRALDGQLSKHLRAAGFKGRVGDVLIYPAHGLAGAESIAVAGIGTSPSVHAIRRAAGICARQVRERASIASTLQQATGGAGVSAAIEGFLLGSYSFTTYKSDPHPSKIQTIKLLGNPQEAELERASARAQATVLARDLTNEPASTLTPRVLAERAGALADVGGLEHKIYDEKELEDKGFGGILGVGRGSEEPPRLIELSYKPSGATGKVVLIGKGITFDSGGLSIKPAGSMETMKTDMAGSAAVLGAMSVLQRLNIKTEVIGLVAAAENLPSGTAVKPGDVLRHYGGKTTEVMNTDAEGRLVLADALAYASELSPDAILDVATLTGAMVVALGHKATGYFSNDEELSRQIESAAERAGERVWRMPLYDDYLKDLESEVADHKNSAGRWGGAIIAAMFLNDFVGKDIPWGHLDIAGPARAEKDYDEVPKGGSGVATRTLLSYLEEKGE